MSLFDVMLSAVSLFGKESELLQSNCPILRNESAAIETSYLPAEKIFSSDLKSK